MSALDTKPVIAASLLITFPNIFQFPSQITKAERIRTEQFRRINTEMVKCDDQP